jgi:vitamin B12 transporter
MPSRSAAAVRDGRAAPAPIVAPFLLGRGRRARAVLFAALAAFAWPEAAARAQTEAEADGGSDGGAADGGAADGAPDAILGDGDGGGAGGATVEAEAPPSPARAAGEGGDAGAPAGVYRSVVSAEQAPEGMARADRTAAASVVRPADSPRAFDDLGTLMLEMPGVNVTRRGGLGSITTLSLRGSNPEQVRFYLDGVPLNQAVGGAVDLSTLPVGDVERVEIYRGSTPIAFPESALGGVVAIDTRTPGTPAASTRAGGGSFRTMFADATAGGRAGPVRLYAGAHVLSARGDYPHDSPPVASGYQPGNRENNDLLQVDGVARLSLPLPGRRELGGGLILFARDQGVPVKDSFRATTARSSATHVLAYTQYRSRDDLGQSSRLSATLFARLTHARFADPDGRVTGTPVATRDRAASAGVAASAERAMATWARAAVVLEGRLERFLPANDLDPTGPAGYPADRALAVAGGELTALVAPLGLYLVPAARLELSRDVRTGRDPMLLDRQRPPGPPALRAQPVVRLSARRPFAGGLEARANAGRYVRIPSFLELYGYDRGVLGNPDLRPEHGVNADLGLTFTRAAGGVAVSATATAFGALVDDLVSWEVYSYTTRAENVARARVLGVESELRLRGPQLGLTAQATLTDARDRSQVAARRDRQLAYHPRYHGYARLEWRQPVGRRLAVVGYVDADAMAGNHDATNAYGGLDSRLLLGAGLAVQQAGGGLRLAAHGADLSDRRAEDFYGYPQPGRTLFVSLSWSAVLSNKE